eukprot:CAMPEP_0171530204 /NCGR_PEP_ID=MMETSP0959-20130129/12893_1 /TAXON_ID=87120 /ORGANISM="Aurantiochytrium limacinum, Strain ATCCMYA-1381" /LENGTH=236 /DNA_ID=CAMNT_0012072861 /DNA_START=271 /DNA_END=981 /DNA_ORIENTATION=-
MSPLLHWTPRVFPPHEVLQGKICRLEPLSFKKHCDGLYKALEGPGSDPVLYEYLLNGPFEERSKFDEWVTQMDSSVDPQFYAIVENKSDLITGLISFLRIDKNDGCIEIGHVAFGATMQRKPIGTEVIYLLGKLAMDDLGYRRLEWKCHNENERSKRAAQRFGFTFEGLFRQHRVCRDRNRDTAWFSIIDSEWPACRDAFENWLDPENFDAEGMQVQTLEAIRASLKAPTSVELEG